MSESKLRILQVHNYYQIPGGEDIVAEAERRLLTEHGHQVFTYRRSNAELQSYKGLKKLRIPFEAVFSLKSYREIKRMIRREHIDIVHVHNTLMMVSPSVFYAAYHSGVPVVQTLHNFRMVCPAGSLFRNDRVCEECLGGKLAPAVKNRCYRDSLSQSFVGALILAVHRLLRTYARAYFICLTDFNWNKISRINRRRTVIDRNRVFIKPNFVYDAGTPDMSPRERDHYLFVGRIEPLKGIEVVIRAFEKMPDKKLVVAGTGPLLAEMKSYVSRHGMNNVEFAGYLDKDTLREQYVSAKALVVASQCYETFGMSVAEAYANGLPVIGGNIGNIGNSIEHGVTGFLFAYDSVDSLVETVQKFESAATDNMRRAARSYYEKKLKPEDNYKMLENIYRTIMTENK